MSTAPATRNQQAKEVLAPSLVQWRFALVVAVVIAVFLLLVIRAAYIQVVEPDLLIKRSDNRTLRVRDLPVYRGIITDRNGEQLAVSVPVRAIWADPKIIHEENSLNNQTLWKALADVLHMDVSALVDKVDNPAKRFVYLQRQVSPAMARYVEALGIGGVYLRDESRRYYPSGEVSAHLIGFTNVDDDGQEGIEKLYNQWLAGEAGTRKIRRDGKGRPIEELYRQEGKAAKDLQLTIDQRLQAIAYKELKQAVLDFKATSASAVIVDVDTAEILALVNSPSFNPNNRKDIAPHRIRNRAVTDAFEPGSSVKPLAVLSALEFGEVQPDDVIDTAPGWMRLGGSIVKDSRNYGQLSLTGIIQKSSNMGTSKLALSVPKEFLLDTYYNMGLMSDTGSNLIGESAGIFHERSRWSDFELSTLSFGYGLSVTTLQLARMYTVIANGGIKQPLSIVAGQSLEQPERVISERSAKAIVAMMESVVNEGGFAKKARVPGYRIAGKTGTSRKAVRGGYGEEYVNTFAGLAPATDPKLVVVILINEPGGEYYYATDTAAPVFGRVMASALQLMNISPDARNVTSVAMQGGANE